MNPDDEQHLVGKVRKRDRMVPMPVTVSGVSCISTLWLLATFLLVSGLIIAGTFPNWIQNRVNSGAQATNLRNSLSSVNLGLYYMCYNLTGCAQDTCDGFCKDKKLCGCYTYLTYDPPVTINSTKGEVVTPTNLRPINSANDFVFLFSGSIVYGLGCFLLGLSLVIGVIGYCKPRIGSCSLFLFAFILQAVAGMHITQIYILYTNVESNNANNSCPMFPT